MIQEPVELLTGTQAALAAGYKSLNAFKQAAELHPIPEQGYRCNGKPAWTRHHLQEWRNRLKPNQPKKRPATIYAITGTLCHGRSGQEAEEINLTGTFDQLTTELFGYMPIMSAREYEAETFRGGFLYWNTDTSGLDEDDPADIAEASKRGLVLDKMAGWGFVEEERRPQTAEELHAYAVEALGPDHPSHIEVKIIEG